MLRSLQKILFGISSKKASFDGLGYRDCDPDIRLHLEKIIHVFIAGYQLAMDVPDRERLVRILEQEFDPHHVGFAYEGTGMYLALLDLLLPRNFSRLRAFTDNEAYKQDYIVTVGAGFAVARIPWGTAMLQRYLRKLDPIVSWCIPDGYGFHQGIFHHPRFLESCQEPPSGLPPHARQLFDAGIGRSLWWVLGADPVRIQQAIDRFQEPRRAELWGGIGLACTYAGGVDDNALLALRDLSGAYRADFLSGIPFACRMRQKGENPSSWTDKACHLLLNMTADQSADLIVKTLDETIAENGEPDASSAQQGYLMLREKLTSAFSEQRDKTIS